jgi:hypothetical protein
MAMSHDDLVAALRSIEGLVDVGGDRPNLHLRSRPFLHFHTGDQGTYADVRFGAGGFTPVPASTPEERAELLARVADHVEALAAARKSRPPHRARTRSRRRDQDRDRDRRRRR